MRSAISTIIELGNLHESWARIGGHSVSESRSEDAAAVIGGGIGNGDVDGGRANVERSVKSGQPAAPPPAGESLVSTIHGRYLWMGIWKARSILLVLAGVNFLNTMGSGILTVALPTIIRDVGMDETILLWPASVYALAAGCTLLLFGAVGDVVGPKRIWVAGASLYTLFTLCVGFCQTPAQLIALRAVLGLAIAMCLPTAVSITTKSFPRGSWRNMGFACQGMGQPLGYSVGLIAGGGLTDSKLTWRWGFYLSAIFNVAFVACAIWALPKPPSFERRAVWRDLRHEVDWVGGLILSASLGLLSYVFAVTSRDYTDLSKSCNIVMLVAAVALIPAFIFWVRRQEQRGRPALIPNSLWKNAAFTSICVAVFFAWASFNGLQYFSSLYFEKVEHLTPKETALRFLPMVIIGVATNLMAGVLVEKVQVHYLLSVSAIIATVSPLLMALVNPSWGYWKGPFIAMLLSPLHPDVLFTVSNLIISQAYPVASQSLAGGVFNAIAQVGNSIGLAVTAAISSAVSRQHQSGVDDGLLKGYHAAFWTCFALMVWVIPITYFGLKKGGKVGASE